MAYGSAMSGTAMAYGSVECGTEVPSRQQLCGTELAHAGVLCSTTMCGVRTNMAYATAVCGTELAHGTCRRRAGSSSRRLSLIHISEPTRPRLI
eukprot:2412899-Rhodomonas_salina.1